MEIEKKWKRYAVGHHLSGCSGDGAGLFDALMDTGDDEDKLSEILEAWDAVVWYLYENDDLVDLAAGIEDMAESLQRTASGELFGKD